MNRTLTTGALAVLLAPMGADRRPPAVSSVAAQDEVTGLVFRLSEGAD